jgi:hypothetical protein
MSVGEDQLTTPSGRIAPWRKWLGIALFVLHLILPVLALILVPLFGLPESVNAVLIGLSVVGGPDVILIASIAMLGKDGVTELMNKFGTIVKRVTKWDAVTRTRYYVGLWVAFIALLLPSVILIFWNGSPTSAERRDGASGFYWPRPSRLSEPSSRWVPPCGHESRPSSHGTPKSSCPKKSIPNRTER